jgi:predicted sugar kinase
MELLANEKPEAIEWAFRQFFREPPPPGSRKWFPEEWEIIALISRWKVQDAERQESERQAANRKHEAEARASGQLVDFVEVKALMRDIVQKTAEKSASVGFEAKRGEQIQPRVIHSAEEWRQKQQAAKAQLEKYGQRME